MVLSYTEQINYLIPSQLNQRSKLLFVRLSVPVSMRASTFLFTRSLLLTSKLRLQKQLIIVQKNRVFIIKENMKCKIQNTYNENIA